MTTQYSVVVCMTYVFFACVTQRVSFANEPQDAHALAQQFANAHKPKPAKVKSKNEIQSKQVEGAFQARKQENDFKTTDQILDSIEARTKAIEALLEESTSDKWNVYDGKPDNVEVITTPIAATATPEVASSHLKPTAPTPAPTLKADPTLTSEDWAATTETTTSPKINHAALSGETSTPQATQPVQPADQPRNVTELPEPGYALGGPANLRHGLAEALSILSTATVLLKMKPGNSGLRRFKKTADPVLCGRRHCYMSKGFEKKATRMLRGITLGPFNTLGRRAGACRQQLTCAFRHVDLMDEGVLLQPVDLKFMRHDRRAYRNIKADSSCKISAGRLHCANPIKAKTWTAWIVPEHIALEAGHDALKTALQDGLPENPVPTVHVKRDVHETDPVE